ncbi:hypothetical protein [Microvirga flavescens]|uniref:hypothetical protein n=1 Tax=Microvirga flavescens TaxID=2249811 RepID=UPI001300853B|nr:hypothetical protein [Microvirga flavescens]
MKFHFLSALKRMLAAPTKVPKDTRKALIRAYLLQERKRLEATPHTRGTSLSEHLNRKRFARKVVSRRAKALRRRQGPRKAIEKKLLLIRYRESPLLAGLMPGRKERWVRITARDSGPDRTEIYLEGFSFIDHPAETLAKLKQIAEVECGGLNALLHFKDQYCLDIGPYLVLGELWPCLSPFFNGGEMGTSVQKVMEAVGLRHIMKMRLEDVKDLRNIWAFRVHRRTPQGVNRSINQLLEPQRDNQVADDFCDAVDRWLGVPDIGQELTPEGRVWISTIILELLDNAVRHSAPATKDGGWSIAGFMARRQEGEDWVYRCYIGILSVGATIDESLEFASDRIKIELDQYVNQFQGQKEAPSAATLRTLYALQDGVTCDPKADGKGRGGFGLQEVMGLVNELGNTDKPARAPRMVIISGRSCIIVRAPYIKGMQMAGEDSPRVLWFNPENTAEKLPDASYVFDLQERFAGTIISLAFTLDPDYLNEAQND